MAAIGNLSCGAFSSWRQTMSGDASANHRRRTGSRPLTPFTLKVAIFISQDYRVAWPRL
jgi:hypothetical protein